jgi:pyrroline-5-carboxylate reductase
MPDSPYPYRLGLIGAGNMAEAIARGVMSSGLIPAAGLIASDPVGARRGLFEGQLGVKCLDDNRHAAESAETLLLAVKPQHMREVLGGLAEAVTERQVIVSIMAGVSTATLEGLFPRIAARVVRVMPNLPMAVGAGTAAVAPGRNAKPADVEWTLSIFRSGGEAVAVEERFMDAVTAISGSGPAYFYYWTEAMIAAGVELGLTAEQAAALSKSTALGAAKMMLQSPEPPEELRRRVTSPGGTTLAAITTMNAGHVRDEIIRAVHAAARRSAELGQ